MRAVAGPAGRGGLQRLDAVAVGQAFQRGEQVVVDVAGDDRQDRSVAGGARTGGAARAAGGQLVEGDGEFQADRLAGPLGQGVGGDQPGAGFLQRVMPALDRKSVV